MDEQEKRAKVVKQISEAWDEVKKQLKCQHTCTSICHNTLECWEQNCICEDEHK